MIVLGELPEHARLLRAIRLQRGWSQGRLAHELCVSLSTVKRWERAGKEPPLGWMSLLRAMNHASLSATVEAHAEAMAFIELDVTCKNLTQKEALALLETLNRTRLVLIEAVERLKEDAA